MRPLLGALLCPICSFILTELFLYNPFTEMSLAPWVLNAWFYLCFAGLLICMTGRLCLALRIQTVLCLIVGLTNYYVMQFRSTPIMPWDIYSLRTAVSVADNYSFTVPLRVILVIVGFVLLFWAERFADRRFARKKSRLLYGFAFLFLLATFVMHMHRDEIVAKLRLYDKLFTPGVMQKRNGLAVAFARETKYLVVQKPDGYRVEDAKALLKQYENEDEASVRENEYPNIIVIMDEAFSDMAIDGSFTPNRDYMPYIRSLLSDEKVLTGKLAVSVLGGNTANTEFEFLTGHSMAFFPQGSIPFQQYITKDIDALPRELDALGYATEAMHPYYAKGWMRNVTYPHLGFRKMTFLEDMDVADDDLVRKYVSDAADFDMIVDHFEKRDPDKPLFLFNVTMQNHGGYTGDFENFKPDITAEGIDSQPLSNYLSLVSLTDRAVEDLLTYFAQRPEPTVIVFFGDHQPNDSVASPIYKANGKSVQSLTDEETDDRYLVPFFIWSNYDLPGECAISKGACVSANYLAGIMLQAAGMPQSGYRRYLNELSLEYPVVSARVVRGADGMRHETETASRDERLATYERLQYYEMFDDEK